MFSLLAAVMPMPVIVPVSSRGGGQLPPEALVWVGIATLLGVLAAIGVAIYHIALRWKENKTKTGYRHQYDGMDIFFHLFLGALAPGMAILIIVMIVAGLSYL